MTCFASLPAVHLPDPHGHDYYAFFYLLGFGVAGLLLLRAGQRRAYPWRPWLLLVAGTLLLFILGTKLIAGTAADWLALGRTGAWPPGAARSVLGGLLGAMVGAEALRRALGFRDLRVYDAFALPFAVGLAVQGVGCLLAGCCFGTLVGPGLPGVAYVAHTAPWAWQVARGLIGADAPFALPVVPVQAAQVVLCGLIAATLVGIRRTRRLAGVAGGEWLLAAGLFAVGRFGLEFWRDGAGDVVGAGAWNGLKLVQWGLAAGALGMLGTLAGLLARAARPGATAAPAFRGAPPPDQALPNLLVLAGLLALSAAPAAQLLTVPETLVVRALLLPVLMLESARWLPGWGPASTGRFYPAPLVLLLGAAGLMSQVPAPPDSVPTAPVNPFYSPLTRPATPPSAPVPMPDPPAPLPAPYTTLSLGGVVGRSHQLYDVQSSCNPSYPNIATLPGYHQRQWNAAFGVARTWARPTNNGSRTTTFGVDVSVGGVRNTPGDYASPAYSGYGYYGPTDPKVDFYRYRYPGALVAVSPYLRFDYRTADGNRFTWGVGVHAGRLAYDYVDQPGRSRKGLPILLFEFGRPRAVYAHLSTYHGLNGVGNGSWWLGVGHSTTNERVKALAGLAVPHSNRSTALEINVFGTNDNFSAPISWFAQLQLDVSPRWTVAASGQSNFNDASRFGGSLHYRLGALSAPR